MKLGPAVAEVLKTELTFHVDSKYIEFVSSDVTH